jgi:hypothetical protein
MWTLLLIATLVLVTFTMFVWRHEDRARMPFEATLTDEDRARLHQLIHRVRSPHTEDRARHIHRDMR